MNILITQRYSKNQYGDWIDSLENNYIKFFEKFGINLIPVSNAIDNLECLYENINLSGIIFTGGENIETKYFVEKNNEPNLRESLETKLLNHSIKNNIPLFGICRGSQFINVFFKGKLIYDIKKIDSKGSHSCPGVHDIHISDGRLRMLLNGEKIFSTNSYHNQGILKSELGNGLMSFAEYPDLNLVEGLYHKHHPIAGILWHPERKDSSTELDKILVELFLEKKLFWEIKD